MIFGHGKPVEVHLYLICDSAVLPSEKKWNKTRQTNKKILTNQNKSGVP